MSPRALLLSLLGAALGAALGCQGSPAAVIPATNPEQLSRPSEAISDEFGATQAALGAWTLHLDPAGLSAQIAPLRTAAATSFGQGDNYLLSVRPFFDKGDLRVSAVGIEPTGEVRLSVTVRHPFDTPADTTRPATASKRLDLHITGAHLLLVADGTDSFFGGSVTLDHGLVVNADGYRNPGPMFDAAAMGVGSANAFPYVILGDVNDADYLGNYDPLADGWQGADLLAPAGYGVFPQGAEKTVDLLIDLSGAGSLPLGLVVLAKYQDPRNGATTAEKRANRLPLPGDPAALRYLMPQGADDLERIRLSVTGTIVDNDPPSSAALSGDVLDWDHASTVVAPTAWPDEADLSAIPEDSQPLLAEADVPALLTAPATVSLTPQSGVPLVDLSCAVTNEAGVDVSVPTEYPGLVAITDAQDGDDTAADGVIQQVLGEAAVTPLPGTQPLVPTIRYQTFAVAVEDGPPAGTDFVLGPEIPLYTDPLLSFAEIRWSMFDYKKNLGFDLNGDVYAFYRKNNSPYQWYVSRSADGASSWGAISQVPDPFLGGVINPDSTLTMGISALLNGAPMIMATPDSASPTQLVFLRGADSGANGTTWSATQNASVLSVSNWRTGNVMGDPTNMTRAYLVSRDTATGAPHEDRLTLFRCDNATVAAPNWTFVAYIDDTPHGPVVSEDEVVMQVDLAGNLHFISKYAPIIGQNDVFYRKATNPGGAVSLGPELNVSNSGTDNIVNGQLALNAINEPLVVWERWPGGSSTNADCYIALGNAAGTSFGAPVQMHASATGQQSYPNAIADATNRVAVVWNDKQGAAVERIKIRGFSANLGMAIGNETFLSDPSATDNAFYCRLALDVVRLRAVAVFRRDGQQYQLRSRYFTLP